MVDRQQGKPVPEQVTEVTGVLPRCPRPGYAMLPICAPLGCPRPLKESGKRDEKKGACHGHSGMDSEGGDVIERVVQLLADGLVLHLLCIDLIWGVPRGGEEGARGRRWRRGGGRKYGEEGKRKRRGGGGWKMGKGARGGGGDGGGEEERRERRL